VTGRESASGTYFLSTDKSLGLPDEVFDDVLCPGGPAIGGRCDPTTARGS
jgi:hypothetical protein